MNFIPFVSLLNLSVFESLDFKEWIAVAVVVAIILLFIKKFTDMKKGKNLQESGELYPITVETEKTESKNENKKSEDSVYTGYVTLENISEQDAAVIMAITSHKLGIPLDKLGFCSIKLKETELINIEEQDAAAVMAITSHKLGVSPENLHFNSIKLSEE